MKFIIVLLVSLFTTSCTTNVPKAESFPPSQQKKALMAHHWSLIAQDAAQRTRTALTKQGFSSSTPIFIAETSNYDFDKAFKKYMIAHLIEMGAAVSTLPEGSIEVKFESQVIRHSRAIDLEVSGYKPGMLAAGVASFWVLRDIFKSGSQSGSYGSVAIAGGYDAYRALNPGETPVELILTTSITNKNRYVMLNADAYYIEKGEEWLFDGCGTRRRCRK